MKIIQLFAGLENKANKKFAVFNNTQLTYAQLLEAIKKITLLFQEKGFKKGDRIILSVSNDLDTTLFFLAALRNGIAPVLIDSSVKKERAKAIISAASPSGFVMDATTVTEWGIEMETPAILVQQTHQKKGKLFAKLLGKKSTDNAAVPQYYPELVENMNAAKAQFPNEVADDTVAYIIYTSGTTADNKGVVITHTNLFTHLQTLSNVYGLNENANILNILNLYHADGMIQGPVLALYNQATIFRPFKFNISEIGELFLSIYRLRISHLFLVPAIISLMDKFSESYEDSFQTDDFRFVISVSSHIEEPLWNRFSEKFKTRIVNVYGLTETVAGSLFCGPGDDSFRIGTIGKPIDCEAKIIDDNGNELSTGQEGELALKGRHIMHAYLNNEVATKQSLKYDWLLTGDIAVKDAEGFYRITGRKKNIIISGGFNIHPEEITEILNIHPSVSESVSFGIPDEVFGEKLVSCAVLKEYSNCSEAELTEYCRRNLEPEKVPAKIALMTSLPKGLSGKVKLEEVKQFFLAAQHSQTVMNDSVLTTIIQSAAGAFRVPAEELNHNSTSYTVSGWDSLSHLILITELEEKFNIRFGTAEVMIMNSIASIESVINSKLN